MKWEEILKTDEELEKLFGSIKFSDDAAKSLYNQTLQSLQGRPKSEFKANMMRTYSHNNKQPITVEQINQAKQYAESVGQASSLPSKRYGEY